VTPLVRSWDGHLACKKKLAAIIARDFEDSAIHGGVTAEKKVS